MPPEYIFHRRNCWILMKQYAQTIYNQSMRILTSETGADPKILNPGAQLYIYYHAEQGGANLFF